ncbi:MAG: SDR family oxidoreductase [Chloroflexota bacterium]
MNTILISGANRGIGFEMTQQLLTAGHRVFASCRRPGAADALQRLNGEFGDMLHVVQMDVAADDSVAQAFTTVANHTTHLDWLINNAGINLRQKYEQFNSQDMLNTFNINAVGAMRVATTFVPLLQKGTAPKLANISSQLGSLSKARKGWGTYGYNSSKSAMNMISRHLAFDLDEAGVTVVAIHPGWVQTDMGGQNAAVTVPDSAAGIINVLSGLTHESTGQFFTYQNDAHPW